MANERVMSKLSRRINWTLKPEKEQLRKMENPRSNPKDDGITVVAKEGNTNPGNTRIMVEESKESGKENQVGARSPNPSARTTGGTTVEVVAKKNINETVTPRGAVEVLANVEGDSVELSGGDQVGKVHAKSLHVTVRSQHKTTSGKIFDLNGTVIPALPATVNPNLGSVYELQFRVMQETLGVMEKNFEVLKEVTMKALDEIEQAIVLEMELLKQCLWHVLQNAIVEQRQFENEGDNESIGNFKDVDKEADLSPRVNGKSGKKGKKKAQNEEAPQPTRIFPRRSTFD
ncbi:hypothetical protein A4A49_24526 [Nicotiana attenuata]|uniref:Uncharacterized protein n=1 Tax=Nicotiana attenuata TaxID=49451 RepID=A0A1J6L701_NICAT|nr:hypothetical protein A4A49_24526 [Nicotiana attenuata]